MRTFLDTGVLIAAYRGEASIRRRALELLDDSDRVFVSSEFVKLELLPKALWHKRDDEVAFYRAFLSGAIDIPITAELAQDAFREASEFGLGAVDALHVAAAKAGRCAELLTTEREGKPIFRAEGIRVLGLA